MSPCSSTTSQSTQKDCNNAKSFLIRRKESYCIICLTEFVQIQNYLQRLSSDGFDTENQPCSNPRAISFWAQVCQITMLVHVASSWLRIMTSASVLHMADYKSAPLRSSYRHPTDFCLRDYIENREEPNHGSLLLANATWKFDIPVQLDARSVLETCLNDDYAGFFFRLSNNHRNLAWSENSMRPFDGAQSLFRLGNEDEAI